MLDVKFVSRNLRVVIREWYAWLADKAAYQDEWRRNLSTLDSNIIRSIKSRGYYSGQWFFDKLMSRADYPLDEKWITDYKGAFKFLTKKRSKAQLESDGITGHINHWAEKD